MFYVWANKIKLFNNSLKSMPNQKVLPVSYSSFFQKWDSWTNYLLRELLTVQLFAGS